MQVGGTPALLKYLLSRNLVDGSCMTVTGKTLADNLEACPGLKEGQQVGVGVGVMRVCVCARARMCMHVCMHAWVLARASLHGR